MKTAARPSLGDSASMDRTLEFLKELVDAHGVPGFEDDVARVMQKHLKGVGEITRDRLGSFICEKPGDAKGPKVMLAGHLDDHQYAGGIAERGADHRPRQRARARQQGDRIKSACPVSNGTFVILSGSPFRQNVRVAPSSSNISSRCLSQWSCHSCLGPPARLGSIIETSASISMTFFMPRHIRQPIGYKPSSMEYAIRSAGSYNFHGPMARTMRTRSMRSACCSRFPRSSRSRWLTRPEPNGASYPD